MSDADPTTASGACTSDSGRSRLAARTVERCERCGAERAWGAATACRCLTPRWQAFCTRCARGFGEALAAGDSVAGSQGARNPGPAGDASGRTGEAVVTHTERGEILAVRGGGTPPLCPSCVEIATVNGAKLRVALDARLVGLARLPDLAAAWGRIETRAREALAMFGLDAAVAPLPEWAARLSDKTRALPPGADSSRTKRDAVSALRLEDAGVRLALERLGYLGRPVEEKLRRTLDSGAAATALLAGWDGLAASAEHEHELREAADALMVAVQTTRTLVDSLRKRDLGPVVEAAVRRQRAVEGCRRALGVG